MDQAPKSTRTKRPSMYDVARQAGVSQTTVSFVVNDTPNANIPEETRERVWAAIRELGWRPNATARSLSQRRSHTIGVISDEIVTSSHAGKIIQGAQDAAWANDKVLLLITTGHDRQIEQRGIEMMLERQVEGLIYATMYHRQVTVPPITAGIPLVLIDCYASDAAYPSIVPDEVQGGRAATEALIRLGHRRIGFINNIDPIPAVAGRREGYLAALNAAGLPYAKELLRSGTSTAAEGHRCARELLQLPARPTAIFCFSDVMAMGAYDAVKQRGLRIPDDVAIVGFDNLEVIAEHLHPPLSTMELPHYAMGRWAVNYILNHTGEPLAQPPQQRLACTFIERASTTTVA